MECLYLSTPTEKIINLKNVSTILVDTERCKIIYNFINSINIMERETPDYTYQTFDSPEETLREFESIKKIQFVKDNFLISEDIKNLGEIVNKNFITSINIDEKRKRIVFNLNFSITILDHKTRKPIKISKFVYYDYKTTADLKTELGKFVEKLV